MRNHLALTGIVHDDLAPGHLNHQPLTNLMLWDIKGKVEVCNIPDDLALCYLQVGSVAN